MANKAHHNTPRYKQGRAQLRALAEAHPDTAVCQCGLTLPQHPLGANGKAQTWDAGHTVNGSMTWQLWTQVTTPPPPGDWLSLHASRCNRAAGNTSRYGNALGL